METLKAIFTRRSIRKYSGDMISDDQLEILLRAAMQAPSARNRQPWHFIVFDDPSKKNAIMKFHQNAGMLTEAKKCILICYDEKLQHNEGYGVIDCSAATQNLLLAAHALGLGGCWVGICPRKARMEAMKQLFELPDHIVPFSLISLGYPSESKSTPVRIKPERIHYGNW